MKIKNAKYEEKIRKPLLWEWGFVEWIIVLCVVTFVLVKELLK